MDKARLRKEAKERRRALAARWDGMAAAALEGVVLAEVARVGAKVVAVYMPVQDECPPGDVPHRLSKAGIKVVLPVVLDVEQPMIFRQWEMNASVMGGLFGIAVPGPEAPALAPDLVLVPLLAYDGRGHRLGYGKGCYDRTLAALRRNGRIQAIGLAYDGQKVDALPADGYDVALDAVATPSGIERFDS